MAGLLIVAAIVLLAIHVLGNNKSSETTTTTPQSSTSSAESVGPTVIQAADNTYTTSKYSGSGSSSIRLAKDASGTWYAYLNDGSIAWNYSGFVSNDSGTWYVEDGKVASDKTGTFIDGNGTKYVLEEGKLVED